MVGTDTCAALPDNPSDMNAVGYGPLMAGINRVNTLLMYDSYAPVDATCSAVACDFEDEQRGGGEVHVFNPVEAEKQRMKEQEEAVREEEQLYDGGDVESIRVAQTIAALLQEATHLLLYATPPDLAVGAEDAARLVRARRLPHRLARRRGGRRRGRRGGRRLKELLPTRQ